MGLEFERPVGIKADENELLYISALQQCGDEELRKSASLRPENIRHFLLSRYGLDISKETVQKTVLNDRCELDLISIVSALFVPAFKKLATPIEEREGLETICPHLLNKVVEMILHDVTGDTEPKTLTLSLVRDIFVMYGEKDAVSDDEVLQKLLLVATEGKENVEFNAETMLRILTHDLQEFDVRKEVEATTNMMDVFGNDCMGCHGISVKREVEEEDCDKKNGENGASGESLFIKRITTGKAIDFIAGTYSCKYQVVCVWSFFVFTFMGYVYPLVTDFQRRSVTGNCAETTFTYLTSWADNATPFRCSIAKSILDWLLLFAAIIANGLFIVWFGCIGYESEPTGSVSRRAASRVVSIIFIAFALLAGPIWLDGFGPGTDPRYYFLRVAAFILGLVVLGLRLIRELHTKFFHSDALEKGTAVIQESQLNRASTVKIKLMQQNAMKTFTPIQKDTSVIRQYYGQALSNYTKHHDRVETIGSFSWFFKRYWNGDIYTKDGCWFSARFLASIFSTFILATFILFTGVFVTNYAYSNWIPPNLLEMQIMNRIEAVMIATANQSLVKNAVNRLVDRVIAFLLNTLSVFDIAGILRLDCFLLGSFLTELCQRSSNATLSDFACNLFIDTENVCDALDQIYRPQQPLFSELENRTMDYFSETLEESFAFNVTLLRDPFVDVVSGVARDNLVSQVNNLYPTDRYMVVIPCVVASIVAVVASYSLTAVVLPSITSTVLKLRCGAIPTMTDKSFTAYRYEMNTMTYIGGCLFWGNLVASILVGSLFGGLAFLCLWQVTIVWIQRLIALIIGVSLVIVVRALFSKYCRATFHRGFYRIRPFEANIVALLNSCLNFALSTATVLIRMGKLLVLASLYVGRIDTPFVAHKVGEYFGGWIQLEGYHRWFIADVLAVEAHRHPYLETLGKLHLLKLKHPKFMTSLGCMWRDIFVIAMMPWLHKYRLIAREENNKGDFPVFSNEDEY